MSINISKIIPEIYKFLQIQQNLCPSRDRHKHNKLHIISGSYMIPEIFLNLSYRRANYSVIKDQKNNVSSYSVNTQALRI